MHLLKRVWALKAKASYSCVPWFDFILQLVSPGRPLSDVRVHDLLRVWIELLDRRRAEGPSF
jgi:hypothetical protein